MRVVDVVPVGAVEAVVDVGPFEGEVGVLLVAELAAVADVVGPAVGVWGADLNLPQNRGDMRYEE